MATYEAERVVLQVVLAKKHGRVKLGETLTGAITLYPVLDGNELLPLHEVVARAIAEAVMVAEESGQ